MSFAALTSAMVVRQGAAPDWRHFQLPPVLYFNTLVLVASSVTLERSRRKIGATLTFGVDLGGLSWLYATLALGASFLVGQVLAWRNLAGQGLFVATNPSSSFFYVLTALHGLHLVGGLVALVVVLYRVQRRTTPAPRSALAATALYWHFMDVLWLYLLSILAFLL